MHLAPPILLSPEERSTLAAWARAKSLPLRLVQRARIITMAADGVPIRTSPGTWRFPGPRCSCGGSVPGPASRWAGKGRPTSRSHPQRPESKVRAIVEATLHTKPPAATHWSARTMAAAQGISRSDGAADLASQQAQATPGADIQGQQRPRFVEKLVDVVGLYLNPPEHALVLCADEKSQIQALDRTQPGLPLKKGRCGTMTHDYKRNGTTTLFAAMVMAR